jgi:hypothetical protein
VRQASEVLARDDRAAPDAAISAVLNALSGSGLPRGISLPADAPDGVTLPASVVRQVQDELGRTRAADNEISVTVSSKAVESAARELARAQPQMPAETRGREPERELPTPEITRHIQKER